MSDSVSNQPLDHPYSFKRQAEMLAGIQVSINRFIPKDEIWLVNSRGEIQKIINIANATDDLSLCTGEMR